MIRPVCTCTVGRVCRPCELIITREDYVRLWNVSPVEIDAVRTRVGAVRRARPAPARMPLKVRSKCPHEGIVLVPCHSCNSENRHVRDCEVHGQCTRTNAGHDPDRVHVCATCDDHPAAKTALPTVVVPEPPEPVLSPTTDAALVTVAAGAAGRELFAVTGPYFRAFADRHGLDLVVLDWPGHPDMPVTCKFQVAKCLGPGKYRRVLYADADVGLGPSCVNPLDYCSPDEFGAVDELPHQHFNPSFGVVGRYHAARKLMGFPDRTGRLPWYFNCGVMVVPESARHVIARPPFPIVKDHCGEQDYVNAVVLREFEAGRLKVRSLDSRCNRQNWYDKDFVTATPDAIRHWSAGGYLRSKRTEHMKAWAATNPL